MRPESQIRVKKSILKKQEDDKLDSAAAKLLGQDFKAGKIFKNSNQSQNRGKNNIASSTSTEIFKSRLLLSGYHPISRATICNRILFKARLYNAFLLVTSSLQSRKFQ